MANATLHDIELPSPERVDEMDALLATVTDDTTIFDLGLDFRAFPTTALERDADLVPLAFLHAVRRRVVRLLAPLEFLRTSGQGSPGDSVRKQHRAIVSALLVAELPEKTSEPSETKLERLASADDRHVKFCNRLRSLEARRYVLQNLRQEVTDMVRERERATWDHITRVKVGIDVHPEEA